MRANSEVRDASTLGVLKLRLRDGGYDWEFLPIPGGTFTDSGSASCHHAPSATQLYLLGGRFRAEVTWRDFAGRSGVGTVVSAAADRSGLFWFFAPDNWELLIKVIDGCSFNDRFWVFSAATTNVGYTLTVTDTMTGQVKRYDNPLGRSAAAVTDTNAFASCP